MSDASQPYGLVAEFTTAADTLHAAEKVRDAGFTRCPQGDLPHLDFVLAHVGADVIDGADPLHCLIHVRPIAHVAGDDLLCAGGNDRRGLRGAMNQRPDCLSAGTERPAHGSACLAGGPGDQAARVGQESALARGHEKSGDAITADAGQGQPAMAELPRQPGDGQGRRPGNLAHQVDLSLDTFAANRVKSLRVYATMGRYDFVAFFEAEDQNVAFRIASQISAKGILETETWPVMPFEEFSNLIEK